MVFDPSSIQVPTSPQSTPSIPPVVPSIMSREVAPDAFQQFTNYLRDRMNTLENENLVLRAQVENDNLALRAQVDSLQSEVEDLKRFIAGVGQSIMIPNHVHRSSEDTQFNHNEEAYVSQLDDQEQPSDHRTDQQVYDDQEVPQNPESDDEIEVFDFRHDLETNHEDHVDGIPEYDQEHEPVTLDEEDENMSDVEISVWLDENGDLETDHPYKDDDGSWEELKATWALQKWKFITKAEEKEVDWLSMDLNKNSPKCLRTVLFPRTQRWTKSNPGEYACSMCTNTQKICFRELNGHLVALPLRQEVIGRDEPTIMQFYVAQSSRITRTYRCGNLWN